MAAQKPSPNDDNQLPEQPYMPSPDQYLTALSGQEPVAQVPSPEVTLRRPVRRRRQPRQPGRWRRVVGRTIVALLLLVAASAIGYGVYIANIVAKISTNPVDLSGSSSDSNGRVNILVLGVGDPGHAGEGLSDTMMVLSLDTSNHRIAQISVPRDLRVDVPGYGASKINQANSDGGPQLAEQTVSNTLGIPINYYLKTDFTGLKDIVDAVGGVDVNVKDRLYDPEYPCDNNQYVSCGLDIEPGLQHMDGTKALQYVRCRKGTCGNDFGRAARQQELINLVRTKVVKWNVLLNPAKLTPIVKAVQSNVQTDMGVVQMAEFAREWQQSHGNQPLNLVLSTSAGGYLTQDPSSSDLLPIGGDFSDIRAEVENIFTNPPPVQPSAQ